MLMSWSGRGPTYKGRCRISQEHDVKTRWLLRCDAKFVAGPSLPFDVVDALGRCDLDVLPSSCYV